MSWQKWKPAIAGMALLAAWLAASVTAAAQSPSAPEPSPGDVVPVPAFAWTGFYAGLNGGWGWSQTRAAFVLSGHEVNHTTAGVLVGATLGYNYQYENLVFGIEGDGDYTDISGQTFCPNRAFRCESSLPALATIRPRLGYALGNFHVYGTGGLAIGSFIEEARLIDGHPFGNPAQSIHGAEKTEYGWVAGVGAEYGFLTAFATRVEWLHYRLDGLGFDTDPGFVGDVVHASSKGNILRTAITYKFF